MFSWSTNQIQNWPVFVGKSGAETRKRLIETAMELFVYQGYERTGLAQIARAAEVLPGSLYHFFPSKEDLLRATLEARLELLEPLVLEPIWSRIDDPVERVFGLLDGYRQMLTMTGFQHGCPIGNLVLELAETHPKVRELLAANFDNWKKAIADCFRSASDRLPEGTDADQLANFALTTMEGAVMLARTYRNTDAYDQAIASFRDYVEQLLEAGRQWTVSNRSVKPSASSSNETIQIQAPSPSSGT
jgi:TetR/AcrR family transcriptional regulator, transcriptional repressor for nem operon